MRGYKGAWVKVSPMRKRWPLVANLEELDGAGLEGISKITSDSRKIWWLR